MIGHEKINQQIIQHEQMVERENLELQIERESDIKLTIDEVREHVNAINQSTIQIYQHLLILYDSKAWLVTGCDSWSAFCEDEFKYSPQHMARLTSAAFDYRDLDDYYANRGLTQGEYSWIRQLPERVLREVHHLPIDKKAEMFMQIASDHSMEEFRQRVLAEAKRLKALERASKQSERDEKEKPIAWEKAIQKLSDGFLTIHDDELWKEQGFANFMDCATAIWRQVVVYLAQSDQKANDDEDE